MDLEQIFELGVMLVRAPFRVMQDEHVLQAMPVMFAFNVRQLFTSTFVEEVEFVVTTEVMVPDFVNEAVQLIFV